METTRTSSRPVTSSSLTFPNMLPKLPARALPIKALFSALKSCKYYPIVSLLIGQFLAGNKLGNAVLAFQCTERSRPKQEIWKMKCSFFSSVMKRMQPLSTAALPGEPRNPLSEAFRGKSAKIPTLFIHTDRIQIRYTGLIIRSSSSVLIKTGGFLQNI